MPCTVIRPGDLADTILDNKRHPEWNGERTKLVYAWPKNTELWNKYAEIRAESLRAGRRGEEATEFYRQHRAEMDEGAEVAWPERYNYDELSAIQHAWNLRLQDERAFWAEYQNEPLPETTEPSGGLTADQVADKVNRVPRGEVPADAITLTAFVDVHQSLLYWLVIAWAEDFTGYVVDYGTYPRQDRGYFAAYDARPSLSDILPGAGLEACLRKGLDEAVAACVGREFRRADGAIMRVERCLVDANWGQATDLVYDFCRYSPFAGSLLPSHGRYIGAASRPLNDYQRRPGDRCGLNWRIPSPANARAMRYVIYDTNYWKSFVAGRLAMAIGDRGGLTLFGCNPNDHRLLADHLTAEYRVRTEGRGRVVDEWRQKAVHRDNHWLDCLVGCAVAASIQGIAPPGLERAAKPERKRISFAELQRQKRMRS
jgi:phage terminase large subunit GpA-like protein